MKKIRIGKDINIKCKILTNNEEVTLSGRDLTVYLFSSYNNKILCNYNVVENNYIQFNFKGIEQKDEGIYRLTVYENEGKERQTVVDVCNAFKLVRCTCLEEDDVVNNLEFETVDLTANIEFVSNTTSDVTKEYVDTQLAFKVDKTVYEEDKKTFVLKSELTDLATKEELNTKADKTAIADMLTKTEAASTYQLKGNYLTSIPDEYVTDEELNSKGYATTTQLSNYITTSTANSTFATKEELNSKANTSDIPTNISELINDSGYITVIPDEYITESELNSKGYLTEHQDISNLATKQEVTEGLATKQNKGNYITTIKTINGQTLIGEGNIEIQGGGSGSSGIEEITVEGSNVTQELQPNKYYIFQECTNLTITFAPEIEDVANEYMFTFISGATATKLSLPKDLNFTQEIVMLTNSVYEFNICNNLALFQIYPL